jgi:transmembrane sensor
MTPEEQALIDTAGAVRAKAAEWLARRESEEWDDATRANFDAWLAQSFAHRVAFLRVENAWAQTHRLSVLRKPFSRATPLAKRPWRGTTRIAAVVAVVAGLGTAAMLYPLKSQDQVFRTPLGGRETITLIELNTDTVLRARITADRRQLWLDRGEAFFKVQHDERHPFEVMAGDHRITDIGTQFTVRRDGEKVKVSLLEGSVRFDAPAHSGTKPVYLKPGEELVASAEKISVRALSTAQTSRELGWREGMLFFDNTPLAEAAAEFNRYNTKKIVVADATAGRRMIGANFATGNIALFARMARAVLGLHVQEGADAIVISSTARHANDQNR